MTTTAGSRGNVYLDYQSAKPVDPRVVETMLPFFTERFGNPAALHGAGDDATATIDAARAKFAASIGAMPEEIVFTSGATESSNLALLGFANRNRRAGDHIVISEVDHISIHNLGKALEKAGFRVSKVPPDQFGRIDPEKLHKRITAETILVSVGWASNEIGTVQPIAEIAEVVSAAGAVLHSDAVAVQGQLPIDVSRIGVGMLTLSSNDLYGPQGVGALYLRKGIKVAPVAFGGGQENGLRSGTENLAGIVGMAEAAEIASRELAGDAEHMASLRDRLVREVLAVVPDSYLNGHPTERTPGNAHFRFEGVEGESLLLLMREEGIAIATGSACSSKTLEPSHTLISCGLLHEEAHGSLECTFGRWSTERDVDRVLEVLPGIVDKLRRMSPLYRKS